LKPRAWSERSFLSTPRYVTVVLGTECGLNSVILWTRSSRPKEYSSNPGLAA
jgi:hypothetical protein